MTLKRHAFDVLSVAEVHRDFSTQHILCLDPINTTTFHLSSHSSPDLVSFDLWLFPKMKVKLHYFCLKEAMRRLRHCFSCNVWRNANVRWQLTVVGYYTEYLIR